MIDVWIMRVGEDIAVQFISSRAKEWAKFSEYHDHANGFNLDLPIVFDCADFAELLDQLSPKRWNILDDGGCQQ